MSIRGILPAMEMCGKLFVSSEVLSFTDAGPQDERHSYEKCQYDEFKKRVAKMDELRAAKDGARSN